MALGISERGRSVQLPDNSQINTLRDSSEQSYYAVICLRRTATLALLLSLGVPWKEI